jgi:hypothetical protein
MLEWHDPPFPGASHNCHHALLLPLLHTLVEERVLRSKVKGFLKFF